MTGCLDVFFTYLYMNYMFAIFYASLKALKNFQETCRNSWNFSWASILAVLFTFQRAQLCWLLVWNSVLVQSELKTWFWCEFPGFNAKRCLLVTELLSSGLRVITLAVKVQSASATTHLLPRSQVPSRPLLSFTRKDDVQIGFYWEYSFHRQDPVEALCSLILKYVKQCDKVIIVKVHIHF